MNEKIDTIYRYGVLGLLIGIVLFSFPEPISKIEADEIAAAAAVKVVEKPNPFANVILQARAGYVFDLVANKPIYQKNQNLILPLASLTKIMTAITAIENTATSTIITISPQALGEHGDTGLLVDERWNIVDLLKYTLVVSSNDGAAAVALSLGSEDGSSRHAFIEKMNAEAQKLALTKTRFVNESGLDESTTTAGAYGTAENVARLMAHAIDKYPDIFNATRRPTIEISSIDSISHQGQNTDILVSKVPGLIAGKTGYSDLAGGNLVVAFNAGKDHPVIAVVLGSTYDGRFSDIEQLIQAATLYVSNKK